MLEYYLEDVCLLVLLIMKCYDKSLDHLQEYPHPLEVQASGLSLDLAGVVDVVDVIFLYINLAQDPQDFAELQVRTSGSDLPAQI